MTAVEVGVIAVAGIAGWLIVSKILTHTERDRVDYTDKDWFEILGVTQDAAQSEIEAAYLKQRQRLEKRSPHVMTVPERSEAEGLRRQLDRAYEEGTGSAAASDEQTG